MPDDSELQTEFIKCCGLHSVKSNSRGQDCVIHLLQSGSSHSVADTYVCPVHRAVSISAISHAIPLVPDLKKGTRP